MTTVYDLAREASLPRESGSADTPIRGYQIFDVLERAVSRRAGVSGLCENSDIQLRVEFHLDFVDMGVDCNGEFFRKKAIKETILRILRPSALQSLAHLRQINRALLTSGPTL
jgi:hypothetical protein